MKDQRLITRIATITGLALGAFALSAIAGSWTAPTCAPPNCNTDAPINVGASSQGKVGSFAIGATSPAAGVALDLTGNGFFRNNLAVVGNLILPNGAGPGKVLTTVNSDGVASWQTPVAQQKTLIGQEIIEQWADGTCGQGLGCQRLVFFSADQSNQFSVQARVFLQPHFTRYTGDENIAWWVTNVNSKSFSLHWHTPNSGTSYGEGTVSWMAVGN